MRRFILLFLIFFQIVESVEAQQLWAKLQGGSNVDETLGVTSDASGNTFMTGYFSSVAVINGLNVSVNGLTDIFVSKVLPNGQVDWVKTAGGSQSDRGLGIAVDPSGNILVCGFFTGNLNFGNGVSITSNGGQDAFVVKYNTSGTPVWARSGGSSGNSDRANAIAVDPNGNVAITGQFSGEASFGSLALNSGSPTQNDAFIIKYDSQGNEVWAKQGSSSALDRGLGIAMNSSGAVFTTGQFSGNITFDNTYTNNIQNAAFLIKHSSSGNEEWFRWAGGSEECIGYGLASDGSNVYLTGDFGSSATILGVSPNVTLNSGYEESVFLISVSNSGSINWTETLGSSSEVSSRAVTFRNGQLSIAGWHECTFDQLSEEYGEATFNSIGFKDVWMARFSSSGVFSWARNFGSNSNEEAKSITLLPDGFDVITGAFNSSLIIPVPNANVNGLTAIPLLNPNEGIVYCGDANYGSFEQLNGESSVDGFALKAMDPDRSPYDFYIRQGGGCDLSIPQPCAYRGNFNPCPDTVELCAPYSLQSTLYLVNQTIGFDYNTSWIGPSGVGNTVAPGVSGNFTVTFSSADGCYSNSDQVYAIGLPGPDEPLISDSQGVNVEDNPTSTIFLCPGESVDLWADYDDGLTGSWSGGQINGTVFQDEVTVSQFGQYIFTVEDENGCSSSTNVFVFIYEVPIDATPLMVFPQAQADTIFICTNESLEVELLDANTLLGYDDTEYNIDWSISPSGNIGGNSAQVNFSVTENGWYTIEAFLESDENPCIDDIYQHYATDSVYVYLWPVPTSEVSLTGPVAICPGDTVSLDLSYTGDSINVVGNVVEVYTDSILVAGTGFFQVQVFSVNEFGCETNAVDNHGISSVTTPQLFTQPSNAVICPGDSVQIFAETLGEIYWQGPQGGFEGGDQIWASQSGLYFVEVTFYEGCALVSNTVQVAEYSTPFLSGNNGILCPGGELEIAVVSSSLENIVWLPPLSGTDSIQVVNEPGIYGVEVTSCGITTELSLEVTISQATIQITQPNQEPTCDGDSILIVANPGMASYDWTPEGDSSEEWFTEPGLIQVSAIDTSGCNLISNTIEIDFEPVPPAPQFIFDPVCEGDTLFVSIPASDTVNFLTPNGDLLGIDLEIVIPNFTADTTFIVFLNNEYCEGPIGTLSVSPKPYPDVPLPISDSPVCTGEEITLEVINAEPEVEYIWTAPSGATIEGSNVEYLVLTGDEDGLFSCFADLNGCITDTAFTEVVVFVTREVELPPDTSLCIQTEFVLQPDTIYQSYLWSNGSESSSIIPGQAGEYFILVSDFNGCESMDFFNIDLADCSFNLPNVFTPNGDGLNDTWFLNLDRPLYFEIVVYNRWGRIVYESLNYENSWDGTHYQSGEPCSEGVYFYILRLNNFEGVAFDQAGDLTLIRE